MHRLPFSATLLGLIAGSGCGGGAALLHPAHTLPQDTLSLGAGVTGQLSVGSTSDAVALGRGIAQGNATAADPEQGFVDGALVRASLAPEIAPWISGRLGLGSNFEGGLTYSGRSVRADARRSFEQGAFALSLGVGASAVLISLQETPVTSSPDDLPPNTRLRPEAFDFSTTGFGFDLPVLAGWRSQGDFLQAWLGGRAHFEHIRGQLALADAPNGTDAVVSTQHAEARANRWAASGLVGLAVGARPVWVRLELTTTFHRIDGQLAFPETDIEPQRVDTGFSAITLSPSAGLVGVF